MGEKTVFNKRSGENWTTIRKRMKLEHFLTPYIKFKSKWTKVLNVRPETIHQLEENTGSTLLYRSLSNSVSPQERKAKAKINNWHLIKPKSFCTVKETTNKTKRQSIEW